MATTARLELTKVKVYHKDKVMIKSKRGVLIMTQVNHYPYKGDWGIDLYNSKTSKDITEMIKEGRLYTLRAKAKDGKITGDIVIHTATGYKGNKVNKISAQGYMGVTIL